MQSSFVFYKAHKVRANLRFLLCLEDMWLLPPTEQDVSLLLKTSPLKLVVSTYIWLERGINGDEQYFPRIKLSAQTSGI